MQNPILRCLTGMLALLLSGEAAAQIELVGQLEPSSTAEYGDVWAEGDYAYLGTRGFEGVFIIDISDPSIPHVAANYLPSRGFAPQDVKVQNGLGFFAMNSGGVDIVDLSDPTQPEFISHINTGAHNVFIDNHLLYTTSNSFTHVYDVSDPANPVYWHTLDVGVHDITVIGDRLYTSSFSAGTRIWDISNMTAIQPPVELALILTGASSHSSWSTPDGTLLVNAQERGNGDVGLFDISDMTNPAIHARIKGNDFTSHSVSPHNPLLVDDRLYVSWYEHGLQVFDVSDRARPIHLGRFDTKSNWGVYPFLGPDKILVSDMQDGLIIVNVTDVLDSPQSDFNEDGSIAIEDIDMLVAAVSSGSTDARFDLNTDGVVDFGDIWGWLAVGGAANLPYNEQFLVRRYLRADANLDGNVDGLDFILWSANKFQAVTGWSNGDFNADGRVDGLDFIIWNDNKFTTSNPVFIPEPHSLALVFALLPIFRRRRNGIRT